MRSVEVRRRAPGACAAAAFVAVLLMVAGCGQSGGKPNGIAAKSAAEIHATALAFALRASSVEIHGIFATSSGPFNFDLRVVRGKGGIARLSKGGQDLDAIRIGSADYIRDSGSFFKQAAGRAAAAAEFPGNWLQLPVECTTQFTCGARRVVAALTNMRALVATDMRRVILGTAPDHPRFVKIGPARVDGRLVVALKDVNARDKGYGELFYVAATGTPYPVEVKRPAGTWRGSTTYGHWNERVALKAPGSSIRCLAPSNDPFSPCAPRLPSSAQRVSSPDISVDELLADPHDSQIVFALSVGTLRRSVDGGKSWRKVKLTNAYVGTLVFDPQTSNTLYAGGELSGVLVSTDRGATWRQAALKGKSVDALAIVSSADVLYALKSHVMLRSTDRGASWQEVGHVGKSVDMLVPDPRNSQVLYAISTTGGPAFKTVNGGTSWRRLHIDAPDLEALAPDPQNSQNVYAGFSGGLIKSTNGGLTWRSTSLADDVHAIVLDPRSPRNIYVGGLDGLYSSPDAGANWHRLGLNGLSVETLTISSDGVLYAGTDDGDVFKFRLAG